MVITSFSLAPLMISAGKLVISTGKFYKTCLFRIGKPTLLPHFTLSVLFLLFLVHTNCFCTHICAFSSKKKMSLTWVSLGSLKRVPRTNHSGRRNCPNSYYALFGLAFVPKSLLDVLGVWENCETCGSSLIFFLQCPKHARNSRK